MWSAFPRFDDPGKTTHAEGLKHQRTAFRGQSVGVLSGGVCDSDYFTRIRSLICKILVGLMPFRAQILETVVPYRLAKADKVSPLRMI